MLSDLKLDLMPIATIEQLQVLQRACRDVYVDPALIQSAGTRSGVN